MSYFLPSWAKEKIIMRWYQNSSYVDGVWNYSRYSEREIFASVQSVPPSERNMNPEGYDPRGNLVIFTTEPTIQLIEQGGQDSVFFKIKDEFYFMTDWAQWNYLMPHWRISVVSQNNMPFPAPEVFDLFDGYRYDAWTHDAWSGQL
jgi:hypothetical protein